MGKSSKHKKKKSKKSSKKKSNSSSSSSSSDEWQEATTNVVDSVSSTTATTNVDGKSENTNDGRAAWMDSTSVLGSLTAKPTKKVQKEEPDIDKPPPVHSRELNSYWKANGTGLPSERNESGKNASHVPIVGDGGASWRARALKRARERAEAEGRPLEEVVAERHASSAELFASVVEREQQRGGRRDNNDDEQRHRHHRDSDRHRHRSRHDDRGASRDYLRRERDAELRFARPRAHDDEYERTSHSRHRRDANTDEFGRERRPEQSSSSTKRGKLSAAERAANRYAARSEPSDAVSSSTTATNGVTVTATPPPVSSSTAAVANNQTTTTATTASTLPSTTNNTNAISTVVAPPPDLNKLEAALLRAELRGDDDRIAKLQAKITIAKQQLKELGKNAQQQQQQQQQQQRRAGGHVTEGAPQRKRKRGDATVTHNADGERERYFADDDNVDLAELVRREKAVAAGQRDATLYARRVLDAEGEVVFEAAGSKGGPSTAPRRPLVQGGDDCARCIGTAKAGSSRHLIVARGTRAYLMLPSRPLLDGHCLIVPSEHVASVCKADDDACVEMRNFQKCLMRMFAAQGKDCVFYETVSSLHHSRHTAIECVPMARRDATAAPAYFRKALLESEVEDEWAQHKKVINVPAARGVRGAVPPQFPYFYVQFALGDGLAHVIDDRRDFGNAFARGVIAGLLELDPDVWMGRRRANDRNVDLARSQQFKKQYAPFDWTAALQDATKLQQINRDAVDSSLNTAPRNAAATVERAPQDLIGALRAGSVIDK